MKISICTISDQLIPNLVPLLMDRPDQVWLLVTRQMEERGLAKRFQQLLQGQEMDVVIRRNLPDSKLEQIREFALELAVELEGVSEITLNATGGNKLISLALVETFRESFDEKQLRILYTDTRHHLLEVLYPPQQPSIEMQGVLDVPLYLSAQGVKVRKVDSDDEFWRARAADRKPVTYHLANLLKKEGDAALLGAINALSARSREIGQRHREHLVAPLQSFDNKKQKPRGSWKKALELIAGAGLIQWDGAYQIEFLTLDAARYLGGGWLEEYGWIVAEKCGFDDCRLGVEVTWEEGANRQDKARNEFDLLLVHNNRMLVVECKTANLSREGAKDQEVVSRLESLGRNAGGLFGSSLLLSARVLRPDTRNRCSSLGLVYLEGKQLLKLENGLKEWKERGAFQ